MEKLEYHIRKEKMDYLGQIKNIPSNKKIIIYGAGKIGKKLYRFLLANGIDVFAFCVTEIALNKTREEEKRVYVFEELIKSSDEKNNYFFLVGAKTPVKEKIMDNLFYNNIDFYLDAPTHIEQIVDDAFFRPILEITPKIGCAVNCRFCPQSLLIKKYFQKHNVKMMTLDTFIRCIDKIPQDAIVRFAGFVEPFLNPDAINMIEYAHKTGREISLYTTLMGLNENDIKRLSTIPFREVVLHLPDEKGYAKIPITEKYLSMLKEVISLKKFDGTSWVDRANSQFRPDYQITSLLNGKITITWDIFDRAGNISDNIARSKKEPIRSIYCCVSENLNQNILLPDGTVVLCCMDYGLEFELGNLLTDTYESIVESPVKKKIRESMLYPKRDSDFLCRRCTHSATIDW